MEDMPVIEFKVGEKYENEKGPFEVMSIKGDAMVIQWDSGEQMKSTIEIQHRIQERRLLEKMMAEKAAIAAAEKPKRTAAVRARKKFEGFKPEDFKNKISGTKWRTRDQLGGSVNPLMPATRFTFNSWSAKRQNEIHWSDTAIWKKKKNSHPLKFFARADEKTLAWGIYVERPDQTGTVSADWEAFIEWMRNKENDDWLRGIALEEELEIYDAHQSCFTGVIKPRESDWAVEGSSIRDSADALGPVIDSWPATAWLDLLIAKRISKEETIGMGKDIAFAISKIFGRLLPLYEAVATRGY